MPSWSWNHFNMITNPKHMNCEEGDKNFSIPVLNPPFHFDFHPKGLCLMVKDANVQHTVHIVLLYLFLSHKHVVRVM